MERNWDSLLSCFFPPLCYENRELWEARVRQRQEERNVLESRVWQQTERERERESHQTDGTEERLTRYLGQRNIDWRRSSDLVWGNDVIIRERELSSGVFHYLCDLTIIWVRPGLVSRLGIVIVCHPVSHHQSQIQSCHYWGQTPSQTQSSPVHVI